MTVVDSSVVIDLLVAEDVTEELTALFAGSASPAAPELLVFEVLAVLRRQVLQGVLTADRAGSAVDDLGDVSVELFRGLPFRRRAWELRGNFTAGDALFVALAEQLGEPLATKDRRLAGAARRHAGIETIELG